MSIRLVQQGACDMMCACAVQKRPEECIGFMWPVGPYIARERRVGQWIESFRYCQACSGWVGGHGDAKGPGHMRDLPGHFPPAFAGFFVFPDQADRLSALPVGNGKGAHERV